MSIARLLFDDGHEAVYLEEWRPGARITLPNPRGLEFLVLSGEMRIGAAALQAQSWGRLPAGSALSADVGGEGARVWLKDAPLLHEDVCKLPE